PYYRQFTVDDGLPSNEVYQVRVQSNGMVWFATDRGIARFDGIKFDAFSQNNGLADPTTIVMTEAPAGNMWFGTLSGRLFKMQGDSLVPHPQNALLDSIIDSQNIQAIAIRNDTTWVGLDREVTFRLTKDGQIHRLIEVKSTSTYGLYFKRIDSLQKVFGAQNENQKSLIYKKSQKIQLFFPDFFPPQKTRTYDYPKGSNHGYTNHDFLQVTPNEILFSEAGLLLLLQKDQGLKVIQQNHWGTASMIKDRKGKVWIGNLNGGVWVLDPTNNYAVIHRFLPSMRISSVRQDQEGGYWFSTLNNGVIYMPNVNLRHYTLPQITTDLKIHNLEVLDDQLLIGGLRTGVLALQKAQDGFHEQVLQVTYPIYAFQNLDITPDQSIWATGDSTMYVKMPKSDWTSLSGWGKHFLHYEGENIITVQRNTFRKYNIYKKEILFENKIPGVRAIDFHRDLSGNFWMAGLHGAYAFDSQKFNLHQLPFLKSKIRVNCLTSDSTYLYGATFGKGVFQYHRGDSTFRWITEKDGLVSNTCSAITLDPNGRLWIGTNQGISVFQPSTTGWSLVKTIGRFDGFKAHKVNCLKVYRGRMWIGTDVGLWSLPFEGLAKNKFVPKVLITQKDILSREGKRTWGNRELTHWEINLRFSFAAPLYRNGGEIAYRCVLQPTDSIYRYSNSSDPSVQFNSLLPGAYTVAVQAQNSDGHWGPATTYDFVIRPPYWATWWFRSLLVMVAIALIGGFIVYRYRIQMLKTQWQLQVYESEQKALFAQINPHFIYNALHSAQYYLTSNQGIKAGDHLARFAKLMRGILENSKASFFSIEKELELLELYISLEQERFDGAFEYRIEIDAEVDQLTEIPSMILQPLVENALWHGILNRKDKQGMLTVSFLPEKNGVKISIRDNGIGRKAVQKMQANQNRVHESSGLELIHNRLNILSKYKSRKFNLAFVDHEDETGNPTGTEAQIFLRYEN
ncbi:MAG: two-component regulator propeller domain-containing protein, partial [Salibacteraceae bacterium]